MRILLLVGAPHDLDISHAYYADVLRSIGHEVWIGSVNEFLLRDGDLACPMTQVHADLEPNAPAPGTFLLRSATQFDVAWLLNQPHPRIAESVWQLLWRLNERVSFVNDVVGLQMLNNKNNLSMVVPDGHVPWHLSTNDAEAIAGAISADPGRRWVLKPPNGGCGGDVFVIEPGSSNNRALIQSMTGNATASAAITRGGLLGLQVDYCLLQEYVPHTSEKRIAVVGGEPVAAQEKTLGAHDHRGNVTQGARMAITALTHEEVELAREVGARLLRYGIRFAGLDVAYPMIFEVNLVNPGGLVERMELGVPDPFIAPALEYLISCAQNSAASAASTAMAAGAGEYRA